MSLCDVPIKLIKKTPAHVIYKKPPPPLYKLHPCSTSVSRTFRVYLVVANLWIQQDFNKYLGLFFSWKISELFGSVIVTFCRIKVNRREKMFSGTSASLCWILLSVCFTISASEGSSNITAKPGDNVILPCQVPRNITVKAVEWIRPGLDNATVCVYRDGKCGRNNHPSFRDRVQMNNDLVKNGDVSLILKNVKISDHGTYECFVAEKQSKRRKRAVHLEDAELIKPIINLRVVASGAGAEHTMDGGDEGGGAGDTKNGDGHGLEIGLGVAVLFVIGGVVGVFALKRKGFIKVKSDEQPASKADDQQHI